MPSRFRLGRTGSAAAVRGVGSSGHLGSSPGYPRSTPLARRRCRRDATLWWPAASPVNSDRRRATRCAERSPLVPGGACILALLVSGQASRTVKVPSAQSARAAGKATVDHGAGLVPLA